MPADASVHVNEMRVLCEISAVTAVDQLAEMNTHLHKATEILVTANIDVV